MPSLVCNSRSVTHRVWATWASAGSDRRSVLARLRGSRYQNYCVSLPVEPNNRACARVLDGELIAVRAHVRHKPCPRHGTDAEHAVH